MEKEEMKASEQASASMHGVAANADALAAKGRFEVECIGPDGKVKWRDTIANVVTTAGKNLMLDTILAGAGYTVTGPFMGLISSVGYTTGPVAADTMASHGGWTEAGGANAPAYTAPRKTCVWGAAAAGVKSLSSALQFAFTGQGTVKGLFIVLGSGAVSTVDSTSGTLLSAGLFAAGDKAPSAGDTINVSYNLSL